jgi:hypothetical protein
MIQWKSTLSLSVQGETLDCLLLLLEYWGESPKYRLPLLDYGVKLKLSPAFAIRGTTPAVVRILEYERRYGRV